MGKNTVANLKKRKSKARKKAALKVSSLSTTELLSNAQEHIDAFEYEAAQALCQEVLKREPDNVQALETSSNLCLEMGNVEGAQQCLGRAITLQPEEGHEKYLSMAQLLHEQESLQCYQKSIELLKAQLTTLSRPQNDVSNSATENGKQNMVNIKENGVLNLEKEMPQLQDGNHSVCSSVHCTTTTGIFRELSSQLVGAYCSVAELFMTDLCDEEDAETQCEHYIKDAIAEDPSNPEPYQLMASFLLVKQDTNEAKNYINKSLALWLPKYREARGESAEDAATASFDPVELCPISYQVRLGAVKILVELEDHTVANEILEGLLEEDDEVVDTWYLLGWSHHMQGEEKKPMAAYYLHKALQVHSKIPSSDDQLVSHLQELTVEVGPPEDEEDVDEEELEREIEETEHEEQMETN